MSDKPRDDKWFYYAHQAANDDPFRNTNKVPGRASTIQAMQRMRPWTGEVYIKTCSDDGIDRR